MNEVQIFNFEGNDVREITDQKGNPWFIAKDVCSALGISKHRDALSRLDEDERESVKVDTLGGSQETGIINESGLYSLILRSRKPEAKQFKKWVTSEVLPQIRKSGSFNSQSSINYEELAKVISIAVVSAVTPLIQEINKPTKRKTKKITNSKQLELEIQPEEYYTISAYMKMRKVLLGDLSAHGKILSGICKKEGIMISSVHSSKFVSVNTYPESILKRYFDSIKIG